MKECMRVNKGSKLNSPLTINSPAPSFNGMLPH